MAQEEFPSMEEIQKMTNRAVDQVMKEMGLLYDESPVKTTTLRNILIRTKYHGRLLKREKTEGIIASLAVEFELSEETITSIIYRRR